ncbi:MAG: peptidoglycan bridge formation protein FemAB, partial [Burkholderiaceae bacterium]|nr:peptidoglycan bridge formation protein FemAB [Burkholderiaceae bacterium]
MNTATEDHALDSAPALQALARTAPVRVTTADDTDAHDWQAWVDAHPSATIFHAWAWRAVLTQSFGHRPHFLIARRGTRVVGVLPLMQVKTLLFGHSLVSLPFCPYAGPLGEDRATLDALDHRAEALARELGVEHLEYRSLGASHRGWPSQDLYVVFRKALQAGHDANLSAIPRKQRAMVRKGIKAGLASETGDVDTFFRLFADN